jgi:hypothetical protein
MLHRRAQSATVPNTPVTRDILTSPLGRNLFFFSAEQLRGNVLTPLFTAVSENIIQTNFTKNA